jgi:hypothetical protein
MICQREALLVVLRSTPAERVKKVKPALAPVDGEGAAGASTGGEAKVVAADAGAQEKAPSTKATETAAAGDSKAGATVEKGATSLPTEGAGGGEEAAEEEAEPEVKVTVADMEGEYYPAEAIAFLKANGLYSEHDEAKASGELKTPRQWVG